MSFRSELKAYKDKNGYVTPFPADITQGRQCDNSTMYSSEAAIILEKRLEDVPSDTEEWETLIAKATVAPGVTVRYPGDTTTDAPDNLYGILAASKVLKSPQVAKDFLEYGLWHLGFYNASNPGHIRNKDGSITWANFQWKQPQLIFAALCAAGIQRWWKFWQLPLALWAAGTIAISCIGAPKSDTDSRRLSWLLIQATSSSLLCRLASKLWWKRLYSLYPGGMKDVAALYYQPTGKEENPFAKYWID